VEPARFEKIRRVHPFLAGISRKCSWAERIGHMAAHILPSHPHCIKRRSLFIVSAVRRVALIPRANISGALRTHQMAVLELNVDSFSPFSYSLMSRSPQLLSFYLTSATVLYVHNKLL